MKKTIYALTLFFIFTGLQAQNIEGSLVNATTQLPVENARILNKTDKVSVLADNRGMFSIPYEELPVTLQITALGFEDRQLEINTREEARQILLFPETLSEVLIQGALIPAKLREIPAAVSLISSRDLKRIDPSNLVQAFNYVPGVYVNQGALNTTRLNIRGIGSRAQYSTNRIQAYFNGIPLSTAEGELTLDDIDPEALGKVEIIKGPNSSIFGAGLGGVINLFSEKATPGVNRASAETIFGDFGMRKKTFSASHGTENSSVFANYSDLRSDGFRENSDYERQSGLVNASLTTANGNELSFLANFTRLKAFIPSSINEDDFRNNPSVAASNWAAAKGFESYDRGLLGVSYTHSFSDNFTNTTSTYISFRDAFEPRPFDILKEERVSAGARTTFNLDAQIWELDSKVSFGAEYYREWYETGTFENLYRRFEGRGSVPGERLSNNEQDRYYRNFYAQLNLSLSEKLKIETGFNINNTNYSLTDLYVQDEVDQTGEYGFSTVFSPRIGATYEVGQDKNLYASVSHGFSTPTVAETLTPEGLINTDLRLESGMNYEIGFKGNWLKNALYTELTLYSIQINDLLVAQRVAEDRYVGINAGKTSHNGAELLLSYSTFPLQGLMIKPFLSASYNLFEFREFTDRGMDFSGNRLPGVPQSTVNTGLDIQHENFAVYTNFLAVGEVPLNDANTGFADPYQLLNIKATYDWELLQGLDLRLTAGVNNLLNQNYAASILPNAVGFGGAAPRAYYPGNPRNYFAGLGLHYNF